MSARTDPARGAVTGDDVRTATRWLADHLVQHPVTAFDAQAGPVRWSCWTTAEHVCVAEDNLASHTNRSTTYYEVRTSCGLLKVRADLQEQVRDVVEDGGTYRMVIEERHVVRYLVEVPELEDDGDALGS